MMKNEIDLDLPIFIFYICNNGMSNEKSIEYLNQLKNLYTYDNITSWFIFTNEETRVECIYDRNSIVNKELIEYIKKKFK